MDFASLVAIFAFILNVLVMMSIAYKLLAVAELSHDHTNPPDFCAKVNRLFKPELAVCGFIAFMLLMAGHWFLFLLNLPQIAWNSLLLKEDKYKLEPTKLHTQLGQKEATTQYAMGLVHCVIFFFLYLYM